MPSTFRPVSLQLLHAPAAFFRLAEVAALQVVEDLAGPFPPGRVLDPIDIDLRRLADGLAPLVLEDGVR
jgi:hypothetical protein